MVTVRIDAVHVVDATRFKVPVVGDEVELSPDLKDIVAGESFVALAREPNNDHWPLFALDSAGMVTCLENPNEVSLTVAEVQSVVAAGECDGGPLPAALTECNDTGDEACGAGGESTLLALALGLVAMAFGRRKRARV